MSQHTHQKESILSPAMFVLMKRRLWQLAGVCLGGMTTVFGLLLFTYHPQDASLNTATDQLTTHNFLLSFGAYISDLFLQLFGQTVFMTLPLLTLMSFCFILEKPLTHIKKRIFFFIISFISALILLKIISPFDPLLPHQGHPGGAFGELLTSFLQKHSFYLWCASLLALFPSFILGYLYAVGVAPKELWIFMCRFYSWGLHLFRRGHARTTELSDDFYSHDSSFASETQQSELYKDSHEASAFLASHVLANEDCETQDEYLSQEDAALLRRADNQGWCEEEHAQNKMVSQDENMKTEEEKVPQKVRSLFSFLSSAAKEAHEPINQKVTRASAQKHFEIPAITGEEYQIPSVDLLDKQDAKANAQKMTLDMLNESARQLEDVLEEFGVRGEIAEVVPGPVVTLYELKPAPGIKTARVIGLADDIARSMSALSTRIAVVPGRNVIGIELPNKLRETVYMRDLLISRAYMDTNASLPLILGKDIGGTPVIADLARMPHVLVAGTTGSGKSVSINTMIMSILFKLPPEKCRFIMVDPKMLELSIYDGIPHLLTPVVTDPKKAVIALKWAVKEMENRYRSMAKLGVRNIDGYNERLKEAKQNGELLIRRIQTGFDPDSGKPVFENQSLNADPLPYIIVVVDEMADLMLVAGKEIEAAVQRLAQMARAAGIHLIMATQRPSVDVITGTIKANFPTRISFQVSSKIDSRTILGEQGAEQLLGQGDMLYMSGGGRVVRVHGPFVRDDEVERVVQFLKQQGEPAYEESITQDDDEEEQNSREDDKIAGDPLYAEAVSLVQREGKVSTSFVQRHLQIGYNRAARMIEQMEKEGLISAPNHSGKREVIR